MTPRERHLKTKYGITEEQYDAMLRKQRGRCAVCERPSTEFRIRLSVDHNHSTGEIRGLLCFNCNKFVVGRHREGRLLRNAADYLDSSYTGWFVPEKKKKKRRRRK